MNKTADYILSIKSLEELYETKNLITYMKHMIATGKLKNFMKGYISGEYTNKFFQDAQEVYDKMYKKYECFFENDKEKEDFIFGIVLQAIGYGAEEKK